MVSNFEGSLLSLFVRFKSFFPRFPFLNPSGILTPIFSYCPRDRCPAPSMEVVRKLSQIDIFFSNTLFPPLPGSAASERQAASPSVPAVPLSFTHSCAEPYPLFDRPGVPSIASSFSAFNAVFFSRLRRVFYRTTRFLPRVAPSLFKNTAPPVLSFPPRRTDFDATFHRGFSYSIRKRLRSPPA